MIRRFIYSILILCLFGSFYKNKSVLVTFKNSSSENFKELHVWIMKNKFDFYNIKPGQVTDEISVSAIYNTCTVQVITQKGKLAFMPIDHVGETAITEGKKEFTLTITSDSNGKQKLELQ